MSAGVRYERCYDLWESGAKRTIAFYEVHDRRTGLTLGRVEHFPGSEWYAWSNDPFGFVGTARTRREATDLILGAIS